MILKLVRPGEQQIESLFPAGSIDSRIHARAATVVGDPTTAFQSTIAFAFARNQRAFRDDVDAACQ